VYNTVGWKESEDVEAAVDFFRATVPLEKIHIYSESLGAVAAILASARAAERGFRLVDGGILAMSPFPNARRLIQRLGKTQLKDETLAIVRWFFQRLLLLSGKSYDSFAGYLHDSAKSYDVPLPTLYRRSSIDRKFRKVNVPLLMVSAEDDPLVPPAEIDRMSRALRGLENPALVRLSWGSHCLFELADPDWYWGLVQEFFDFHCLLPAAPAKRSAKRLSRSPG
jgi:pimeloyl-ACP methyl ester carboxylesterase